MPIPNYQEFMLPLLEAVADGRTHRMRDLTERLADRFQLTEAERQQLLPSGQTTYVASRVGWARTYLKKAGLVEGPGRGLLCINDEGRKALASRPSKIDNTFLEQYAGYNEFVARPKDDLDSKDGEVTSTKTPDEILEDSFRDLRIALADEILAQVKSCSPAFFERLVVELLVAMGYGGSLADAGQAVGRTGDGGIDGIIKEDKLGLDVVCVQAKRWKDTVGSSVVREFAGSMEGIRARKGVLITTSSFSRDAWDFVGRVERKIVLVDGKRLAELMIDYNVGVTTARTYAVKKVDSDYFVEEEG
jgi:restriction system protein